MSLFIGTIILFVAATLFAIAGNVWQKGGYDNAWFAFFWGIGGFLLTGFAIFFLYYAYVIKPASPQNHKRLSFSVVSEITIHNIERNFSTHFWFLGRVGNKVVGSPITDVMYIRFTNGLKSPPLLFDHFLLEVRAAKKRRSAWRVATAFDAREVESGKMFTLQGNGPEQAREVTFQQPNFQTVVRDKTIGAGESVRGLIFVERPAGLDNIELEWRFTAKDVDGNEGRDLISSPIPRKQMNPPSFIDLAYKMGDRQNISGAVPWYYSERSKLPP